MYAIVNKKNNVVVRVVNNYEIIENTLKAKGIFDKNDFNIIETELDVMPKLNKYVNGEFVVNEEFLNDQNNIEVERNNKEFIINVQDQIIDLLIHIVKENNLTVSQEWVAKIQKYKQITNKV